MSFWISAGSVSIFDGTGSSSLVSAWATERVERLPRMIEGSDGIFGRYARSRGVPYVRFDMSLVFGRFCEQSPLHIHSSQGFRAR